MSNENTENYYIIFKDRSIKSVPVSDYEAIVSGFDVPEIISFNIAGSIYDKNSISKVLDEKEYFKEYPDKQPDLDRSRLLGSGRRYPYSSRDRARALTGILKGFDQFVADNGGLDKMKPQTREARAKVAERLEHAKGRVSPKW